MTLTQEQQDKLDDLTNEIRKLGDKLKELRTALAIEAGAARAFELKGQIQETRALMRQLGDQLDAEIINDYLSSMLSIDYTEQVNPVIKHLMAQKQACGAFLVCGPLEFGQLWVIKRAISVSRLKPPCVINLETKTPSKLDTLQLWVLLGDALNMRGQQRTPQTVTDVIVGRLLTQHVSLVFRHIEILRDQQLIDLIENVWKPLVERVRQEKSLEKSPYKLVAFLVDYTGVTCQWSLPCVPPGDAPPQPAYYPIRLESLACFKPEHLQGWANGDGVTILGQKLMEGSTTVQKLLDESDSGVPERVAERLLWLNGYYYDGEKQWIPI